MKGAHEEFEADDGVDDDDEEDEQGDVHQGNDGHQDGVHHNLQTCGRQELNNQLVKNVLSLFHTWDAWDQSERSEDPESSEGLHVKALNL